MPSRSNGPDLGRLDSGSAEPACTSGMSPGLRNSHEAFAGKPGRQCPGLVRQGWLPLSAQEPDGPPAILLEHVLGQLLMPHHWTP